MSAKRQAVRQTPVAHSGTAGLAKSIAWFRLTAEDAGSPEFLGDPRHTCPGRRLRRVLRGQLIALAAENDRPIRVVVHSPGGHVESADTVFDLVRAIDAPVTMLATGWVASAGALVYASVPRDRRLALPNTRFLLHQPLGTMSGPATDVEIEARQIQVMRKRLVRTFADATGQSPERIERDSDRNYWLNAGEAVEYGLVGQVVSTWAFER